MFKFCITAAVKVCQHAGKSIEQNQVKKNIHLEDIENNNFCLICSKQGQSIKVVRKQLFCFLIF